MKPKAGPSFAIRQIDMSYKKWKKYLEELCKGVTFLIFLWIVLILTVFLLYCRTKSAPEELAIGVITSIDTDHLVRPQKVANVPRIQNFIK